MAFLTKDAKGRSPYWIACFTTKDGRRLKKSTRSTDKGEAWDVLNTYVRAEGEIVTGSATETQLRKTINDLLTRLGENKLADPSIREQLDNWIASKKGSVSPATLLGYEQARDLLLEFLSYRASRSVRQLTKKDAVAFRDHLSSEGRSPSTVNKICKKYLTGPFESARKEGLIDFNPFVAADALKTKTVEKDTFSPEQVARLIAATDNVDWKGAILVGYCTGMRLQNVANLRWNSIDTEHGLISFVERKGEKPITIGLHPDLSDWIAQNPGGDDPRGFVFPTLANRSAPGRNGLSKYFEGIMKKAGIEGRLLRKKDKKGRSVRSLSFHSFRHGAASAAFKGAALKNIARSVTGHAARGVVDRYIHIDVEAVKAATELIPRLPKAEGSGALDMQF
jgi:integrase